MRSIKRIRIALSAISLCLASSLHAHTADPGYFLIAGSFEDQIHAQNRMLEITRFVHAPVALKPVTHEGKPLYLVKVDAHANFEKAISLQQQLKKHGIDAVTLPDSPKPIAMNETTPLPDTPAAEPLKPIIHKKVHTKEVSEHKVTKRTWNLRNADLRVVIQEVSRVTGKNFLIDPRVEGKISIVSASPMDPAQLYQVFLSMLEISGYAAIREGDVTKIVPSIDAKTMNAPVYGERNGMRGEEVIVQVVPIKYVSAQQLVPILRPMMPQWTALSAYIPSNSLILSGRASNLERMVKIIERVDVANTTSMEVIQLRNGTAADIVKTLSELQTRQQPLGVTPVAISSDDRANAIILSGSSAQRLRLHALISQLDSPNSSNSNDSTQVVYLQFMQAKDLAPILAGVARSHFMGDVGVTIGTRTQDKPPALEKALTSSQDQGTTQTNQPTDNPTTAASNTTQKGQESGHPHVEIIAEPNTNTIILNAQPALMQTLKTVIAKLDIRPMQVSVEALIAEINENDEINLGIDWGTRDNQTATNGSFGTFTNGFGLVRHDYISKFEAQLTALAANNKADILSTPSVVVLDNHLAHIKVGKEVSVKESDYPNNANGTTNATPYNTFKRVSVALVLNVTPQITHDGSIKLLISHQNNTLQNVNTAALGDTPVFNISEISTSVLVANGDILVLGGLIQNGLNDRDTRIPVVGDFPGLGRIFHHPNKTSFRKKLMVFLRPIILQNQDTTIQVTGSKYEALRDAQLEELRHRTQLAEYKEHVLPDYQKPLVLPKPFIPLAEQHQ